MFNPFNIFTIMKKTILTLIISLLGLTLSAQRPGFQAALSAAYSSHTSADHITRGYAIAEADYVKAFNGLPLALSAGATAAISLPRPAEQQHTTAAFNIGLQIGKDLILEPFLCYGLSFGDHTHLFNAAGLRICYFFSPHFGVQAFFQSVNEHQCLTNHTRVADTKRYVSGIGLRISL